MDDLDELTYADLGIEDISLNELKKYYRRGVTNMEQMEKWLDLVLEEILRRGG